MEVSSRQRGFSLIEVLIASAIFLVIALGILPLFTQAMRSNMAGRDSTEVSNAGKSSMEELLQVPYEALELPLGTAEVVREEYWSKSANAWLPGPAPTTAYGYPDDVLWLRTTRLKQFNLTDIQANGVAATALAGGTPRDRVHLKEIVVEVRSARGIGVLGGGKSLTLRMLRAV